MKTKEEIIGRLLQEKQITADEAIVLLMGVTKEVHHWHPTYPSWPTPSWENPGWAPTITCSDNCDNTTHVVKVDQETYDKPQFFANMDWIGGQLVKVR